MKSSRFSSIGALLCGVLFATVTFGQYGQGSALIYPERLRADVEYFRKVIHGTHPDPYRYCTKEELDQVFMAVMDSVSRPMTREQFLFTLLPVFHRIGDARSAPRLDEATEDLLKRHVSLLPLRVRVLDEGLYLDEELKGFQSFSPGSRILSVNGIEAEQMLADLGRWVVTDGANESLRTRLVERDFHVLFAMTYGASESYVVEVMTPDRERAKVTITGLTGEEIERSRKPVGPELQPWRSKWENDNSTLWFVMRSLTRADLGRSKRSVSKAIDRMLAELEQEGAKTLVIDLRGTQGGDPEVASQVFAAIAMAPFKLFQAMTTRHVTATNGEFAIVAPDDHYASVKDFEFPRSEDVAALRPGDDRLRLVQPHAKAFQGKVYVVCDGATRDVAAAFVMLAKRSGRARIVGEEVGSNSQSFCGGREALVTLPRTKLRLHIPLARFVPEGHGDGPVDHGELPHHPVEQQVSGLAIGRDTVKASLLDLIRELQ